MISFAGKVKNELCRVGISRQCCARAEGYGVLLYGNTFTPGEIRIITENGDFAARLPKLFQKAFGVKFDRVPEETNGKGKLIFGITAPEKLEKIINTLGYDARQLTALHVNFGILEEDCCRTAFLRGAFLAGGSVTDPEKRYHLELATSHLQVSRELEVLLRECGYPPKSVTRNGSCITYFKQSDQIEDFLTLIGAPVAAMSVMSAKLEKDLRNSVNRRLNCDNANLDKAVDAALEQIDAIRRLKRTGRLDKLPERLRQTAAARLKNPELSLSELAAGFTPAITKSCLNHRLRKLMELARAVPPEDGEREA